MNKNLEVGLDLTNQVDITPRNVIEKNKHINNFYCFIMENLTNPKDIEIGLDLTKDYNVKNIDLSKYGKDII